MNWLWGAIVACHPGKQTVYGVYGKKKGSYFRNCMYLITRDFKFYLKPNKGL